MIKSLIDPLKSLFGFRSRRQTEFDDAMLSILMAAADSRLSLTDPDPANLDSGKRKELAHAWSEAAIKVNRIDGALRDGCLGLAKAFAAVDSSNGSLAEAGLNEVEAVFARACKCLELGGK